MNNLNVLVLSGIANNQDAKILKINNNIYASYNPHGNSNVYNLLEKKFKTQHLVLDINKSQKIKVKTPNVIFNQISDADTHTITLKKIDNLLKSINKDVKILNSPENILKTTRESIYKQLKNIKNLTVPKTVKFKPKSPNDIFKKIQKEEFKLPVIFRKAGDHGGVSTVLIKSLKKESIFYPFALDGSEYYLTQYVDYKENEKYKKYRLVVVDGEVFVRSCMIGDFWMVHHNSRDKDTHELEMETLEYFNENIKDKIQLIITDIYKKLKLDYFGIDCCINENMEMLIFEINANMNILHITNKDFLKYLNPIKDSLIKMIAKHGN